MQASLMGCALESYVIDDDMLGGGFFDPCVVLKPTKTVWWPM